MFKVLICDDDKNINFLIMRFLQKAGYEVVQAFDVNDALTSLENNYVDLVITDIMMPGIDGFEFTKMLRSTYKELPILIISAKDQLNDKSIGFDLGADDYLVKPFLPEELVLRVGALLRRSKINNDKSLQIGSTILNYETFTVSCNGIDLLLPQKEFLILFKLLSYPDKIFTRHSLMNEFWGPDSDSVERTVDVHINRLRDKFKDNPDFEISTVRNLGYRVIKK